MNIFIRESSNGLFEIKDQNINKCVLKTDKVFKNIVFNEIFFK